MFRDNLSEVFAFRGAIAHYSVCAVISAAYFDESESGRRVGVAGTVAHIKAWQMFDPIWRAALGGYDFHASAGTRRQREFNVLLARVMAPFAMSLCVTLRESDYIRLTSSDERAHLGNAWGFAGLACSVRWGHILHRIGHREFGFYVDHGGKGSVKHLEHLSILYQREGIPGLVDFGPANRRTHMPVHTADLIAHEVITNRHQSEPLSILGERVQIEDLSEEDIEDTLNVYRHALGFVRRHQKGSGRRHPRLGPKRKKR